MNPCVSVIDQESQPLQRCLAKQRSGPALLYDAGFRGHASQFTVQCWDLGFIDAEFRGSGSGG